MEVWQLNIMDAGFAGVKARCAEHGQGMQQAR